jgi:hypothetical protein
MRTFKRHGWIYMVRLKKGKIHEDCKVGNIVEGFTVYWMELVKMSK